MKKIKEAYYYLFYRFYLFSETPPFVDDSSDWKAACFVTLLEILIYLSGYGLYKYYVDTTYVMPNNSPLLIIPMGIIVTVNYLAFLRNDTWKHYKKKFDNWPAEKNRNAGRIVLGIVLAIVLCFSFVMFLATHANHIGNKGALQR